jgi:hypothetical protein
LSRFVQRKIGVCAVDGRARGKGDAAHGRAGGRGGGDQAGGLEVEAPPLIKGYLKLGAKICSAPAWDPDFNTADLLTMLRLSEINPRYAKHFLGK